MNSEAIDCQPEPPLVALQTVPRAALSLSPFAHGWRWPVLLMGFAAVALALRSFVWSDEVFLPQRQVINFFTKFVFLNSTHTGLTYLLLVINPELRALFKESFRRRKSWVLIGLAMLPLFTAVGIVMYFKWHVNHTLLGWFVGGLFLLKARHLSGQAFGISMLYPRERPIRWEKTLFQAFIFLAVVTAYIDYFYQGKANSWLTPLTVVMFIPVLFLIGLSFWAQRGASLERPLFMLRLFCFPFIFRSWLVCFALQSCHGVEYLGLTQNMVQRSRGYKDYLWIGGLLLVLGPYAVLHFPCAMPQTFRGSFNKTLGSAVVGGLLVWAYVFEFMHYYIDSFVFRMKDPLVRLNIGPLLGQPNKILVVK